MRRLLVLVTALLIGQDTATPPVALTVDDQLSNLRIIERVRAIENILHRLRLEYEAKKSQYEAEQQAKMDEYAKFITAKRLAYKVGDTDEIDIDKGVWVKRKPPPPPVSH